MKPRLLAAAVVVVIVAATCVRLGFWQLSRLHQKQALNEAMANALAEPPVPMGDTPPPLAAVNDRRVIARGRWDETRQILLAGRAHDGSPGVDVVTPLVLAGGARAVLVDRGWMYSSDAARARPQDHAEPGEREVIGIATPLRRGAGGVPLRRLPNPESIALYSSRWLDLDTLAARLPYALAPYSLRQMPGPGVPDVPLRTPPKPLDETMHLSYAVQWFLFATILVVGSCALAWSTRRRGATATIPGGPR